MWHDTLGSTFSMRIMECTITFWSPPLNFLGPLVLLGRAAYHFKTTLEKAHQNTVYENPFSQREEGGGEATAVIARSI